MLRFSAVLLVYDVWFLKTDMQYSICCIFVLSRDVSFWKVAGVVALAERKSIYSTLNKYKFSVLSEVPVPPRNLLKPQYSLRDRFQTKMKSRLKFSFTFYIFYNASVYSNFKDRVLYKSRRLRFLFSSCDVIVFF